MICGNLKAENGRLFFAGHDVGALARKYGTPLYLLDEARIRKNCRVYKNAMDASLPAALPLYASKALCCRRVMEIVAEEGLGADVVSAGEIYTACLAGFDPEKLFFHGSSKSDSEIDFALSKGVGYFIVDGEDELYAIDRLAAKHGIRQKVLLRLTPGIDPHTLEAVATGQLDSKFGVPIETGQGEAFVRLALSLAHIDVRGYHAHVGSQVFDSQVFRDTADVMLAFTSEMQKKTGYLPEILNLGGGYGVRYLDCDPQADIPGRIAAVARHLKRRCAEAELPLPFFLMEPGRSIVADAGLTVYTVSTVKHIPGFKRYAIVDGGMADNPRYCLYGARYTVLHADREAGETAVFDLAGRCCESGDILQPAVSLPRDTAPGEHIAVCTTGAYNYSMASNYNRLGRPPVVMLRGGESYVAVRRETVEDLCALDL